MTNGEDVLIVVPCLNEQENVSHVLEALLSDSAVSKACVAVVDGGSTDGTIEIVKAVAARHPRVVLLHNTRKLQSAAVNLAVSQLGATREWMVRADAHCGYPKNFVSNLLMAAQRNGADSVVVPLHSQARGCFQRAVAIAQNSILGSGGAAHRRLNRSGWVDHGHHALFKLDKFLEAGGYDGTFVANEDAEFDHRLVKIGGGIWLDDTMALGYFPRRSGGALFRQYLKYGSGRAGTMLRHQARFKIRQLLPAFVGPAVALLLPALWAPILALPALIWTLISLLFGVGLGVKHRSPCGLFSGFAAMIMHLGWSLGFWNRILRGPGPPFSSPLRDMRRLIDHGKLQTREAVDDVG